ncbi:MAG: hypothetical protein Q8O53_03885 [Candidatus Moranbacteria bacterium]|nr:hypothetical protein [Candidatus Moranbacteria bacterium]
MKQLFKVIGKVLLCVIVLIALLFGYFNLPGPAPREDVNLGMTFSSRYAEGLGLDWRETYLALLDDVGVKKMRLPVYWDLIEKERGVYDFSEVDWQLDEAAKRGVEVILTVGIKVPRWPECHIPEWVGDDLVSRREGILPFIETTVIRYQEHPALAKWQVENEPFLRFGICPPFDVALLEEEIALVKRLDASRPVLLTDSGEISLWIHAAARGDEFGTTLYRDIYSPKVGGYFEYPIGPNFFRFKEWMVRLFTDQENFMIIELQAEPWASGWIADVSLQEQWRTMNENRLVENVDYAKRVGFPEIYLWGGEWWYWLKVKKQYPAVWETGKQLFQQHQL